MMEKNVEKAQADPSIKIERSITFSKNYWTDQEQILYYLYVLQNFKRFSTEARRKQHKVFSVFSKIIKTRSSYQVKSRNQLLLKRYKSLKNYLQEFEFENKAQIQQFLIKNEREPIFQWNFLSLNFKKIHQEISEIIDDEDKNLIKDSLENKSIQSIKNILPYLEREYFYQSFNQQQKGFSLIKNIDFLEEFE